MGEPVSNPFRLFAQSNAPALPYSAETGGYFPPFLINSNAAFFLRLANKADRILQDGDPYVLSPKFTAQDVETLRKGTDLLLSHVQQHTPLPEDVLDQFRVIHSSLLKLSTFFVERMAILRKRVEESTNRRTGLVTHLEFLHASGQYLEMLPYFPNQVGLISAEDDSLRQHFANAGNVVSLAAVRDRKQNYGQLTNSFSALLTQMSRSPDWAKYAAPVSDLDAEIRVFQQERNSSGRIHAAIKATAMRIVTELLAPPTNVIPLRLCRNCG